ncbi:hypothetical protein IED13_01070 [Bosea sp. SSUT16]|uniref:Uncharacterized protein n=1 Tax=Bosea spartocytisi TaxID=2773451 RepID=A0A927HWE6_9HYPH|nr:hypothetical protein [Bosea spartocytisi]MBD3844270.1 hypothetical protein [Bosea spartocytisi]MCT4470624.1 hypothetical protein [Bosea spartocytisi]
MAELPAGFQLLDEPASNTGNGPLVVTVRPNQRPSTTPAPDALPGGFKLLDEPPPQAAPAPEVSMGRSALLGALQGATFNFGDEIASGINAGIDYVTGQAPDGIGAAYDQRLASARQQMQEAEKANPGTFLAGQVGGGIATIPFTPVRAGVAGGLATGAGYGALAGAGGGEGVGNRLIGAGVGAGVGGAVGAAVPAAIGGAQALYGKARDAIGSATGTVRGALNADAEATRRVQAALARDAAIGAPALDEAGLAAAQAAGQPVRVADIGGETTRALARSAANTSPEGRQALQGATGNRFETQGNRAVEFVQRLVGTNGDAGATREALKSAARAANRSAYGRAYAQGSANVWDDTLATIAQAPAVQAEIRDATRRSANKAAAEGQRPVSNPFIVGEDGALAMKPGVSPSLQFWDVVKQGLDDQIEKLQRAGGGGEMNDLIALRNALRDHLDEIVPTYAAARKGAAAAFGAEDALEAGGKFVTSSMSNNDARRAIAKMSEPERKMFAEGFASSLIEQINRTGDRRNLINQIWGTARARERIEIALGKDKARELEAFVNVESVMDMLRTAVSGNSTTARQLAEIGLAGGGATYSMGSGDPKAMTYGLLLAGLSRGQRAIDARVAQRVAEMLLSTDPSAVQKAARTVAKNKTLLESIKGAGDYLTKAIGPAANENVAKPLELTVRPYWSPSSRAAEQDDGERR